MIVACVWVRGNVPFTADYVFRLRSMVRRALPYFHRFICFTDRPGELPGMETITIEPTTVAGWWSKLALFNPAHGLRGPGLYLDLDVLVVDNLAPVAGIAGATPFHEPFLSLIPHAGTFEGRGGLRVVKRYNSSVMAMHFGTTPRIWSDWSPKVASDLWGDQDWIGQGWPNLPTMPLEWFPRLSELRCDCSAAAEEVPWQPSAKVVLCKKPKNHEAAARWPWFERAWR